MKTNHAKLLMAPHVEKDPTRNSNTEAVDIILKNYGFITKVFL